MWETLNTTYREVGEPARAAEPGPRAHDFFGWVRDRAARVHGLVDATMSRDDGWRFFVLGRSLERADMTARLLSARATATRSGAPGWTTTLRTLLRLRGVPAHLPARGRRRRRRSSSCCSTGSSRARCSTRSPPPSDSLGRARPALRARRRRRRGAPAAGPRVRRARVPARRRGARRPARRCSARLQHECADVHAAIARRYFRETRVIEWSV